MVGENGYAVGVDFSEPMIEKGLKLVKKYNIKNVSFIHASIDQLPFKDYSFDVAISNCVLNLVPDKGKAFKEIFRVLKPGGRLVVSDIIIKKPLPAELKSDLAATVGCLGRAVDQETYKSHLDNAKFKEISFSPTGTNIEILFKKPGFNSP